MINVETLVVTNLFKLTLRAPASLNPIVFVSELFSDKSNTHEFVDLVKDLALPGELTQNRSYDFEFMQVEKPYESYTGANVRLRYVHVHVV